MMVMAADDNEHSVIKLRHQMEKSKEKKNIKIDTFMSTPMIGVAMAQQPA